MKKSKLISLFLASVLSIGILNGCGSTSSNSSSTTTSTVASSVESTKTSTTESVSSMADSIISTVTDSTTGGKKIAFCTFTSEGDYWQMMFNLCKQDFEAYGDTMDLISADNDATKQIEQIENCVTQGYDLILLIAVDPDAVADACKKAMDSGVAVFCFIKDPGEEYRTAFRGTSETVVAQTMTELASDYADAKFPDAADGSIKTIIIGGNSAGSETERYNALCEDVKADSRFDVLEAVQWETSQAYAQSSFENMITKYNADINLVLVCSGEMALGVRACVMTDGSGISDYSKFGIITCDLSQETADSIKASVDDTDVIRSAAMNGGNIKKGMQDMVDEAEAILSGNFEKEYIVDVDKVTPDNIADYGY